MMASRSASVMRPQPAISSMLRRQYTVGREQRFFRGQALSLFSGVVAVAVKRVDSRCEIRRADVNRLHVAVTGGVDNRPRQRLHDLEFRLCLVDPAARGRKLDGRESVVAGIENSHITNTDARENQSRQHG